LEHCVVQNKVAPLWLTVYMLQVDRATTTNFYLLMSIACIDNAIDARWAQLSIAKLILHNAVLLTDRNIAAEDDKPDSSC